MNRQVRIASMTDGTSNTLCMSVGKTFTPILRDGGVPSSLGVPTPVTRASVIAFGGSFKVDAGHVEWIDAHSIQSGFTTTFTPNSVVLFASSGKTYDVDFTSRQEGKTSNVPTYSVIAARSFHTGGVNLSLMDGSVRFLSNSVSVEAWRALGSRAGGAVTSDFETTHHHDQAAWSRCNGDES